MEQDRPFICESRGTNRPTATAGHFDVTIRLPPSMSCSRHVVAIRGTAYNTVQSEHPVRPATLHQLHRGTAQCQLGIDLYGQRLPVSRWIAASPTGLMRCVSSLSRACLESLSPLRAEMLPHHQCNQAHEHGESCEQPDNLRFHLLPPSLVAQTRVPRSLPHSSTRRLPAHRPTGQSAHRPDGQISPCTAGQYAASLRASCPLDGDVQPVLLLRENTLYQPAVNARGVS